MLTSRKDDIMNKRMLNHTCSVFVLVFALLILSGCGKSYIEADIEEATKQAYSQGYEDGYKDGHHRGAEEQREEDYEDLLIDGLSIRNIIEEVYNEFGITPSEAFTIVDEYEYDSSHGGYTKSEYRNAIEAMYYTASIFPYDY